MAKIEKDLRISYLFDFYGEMLTENQKQVVDYYYNQDLSLAEIAQHSGITRQGVRDSIKRAERQLLYCEESLGLYQRFHRIREGLEQIQQATGMIVDENRKLGNSPVIDQQARAIAELANRLND